MWKITYRVEQPNRVPTTREVLVNEKELEKALAKYRENYDYPIEIITSREEIDVIN